MGWWGGGWAIKIPTSRVYFWLFFNLKKTTYKLIKSWINNVRRNTSNTKICISFRRFGWGGNGEGVCLIQQLPRFKRLVAHIHLLNMTDPLNKQKRRTSRFSFFFFFPSVSVVRWKVHATIFRSNLTGSARTVRGEF